MPAFNGSPASLLKAVERGAFSTCRNSTVRKAVPFKEIVKLTSQDHTSRIPISHIILRLARTKDFPEGSSRRGYDIRAILDAAGHLDDDIWRHHRTAFSVQRFWDDEPVRHGMLVHRPGGAGGATWTVHYAGPHEEDEDGFRLGEHVLRQNEFVSIRDDEGVMQTFRVTTVKPTGEVLKYSPSN